MKRSILSIAVCLLSLAVLAQADLVLEWDFTGLAGNEASVSATTMGPTMQGGELTRGPGLSLALGADSFAAQGWTSTYSPDMDDYFQFTLTPNPGYMYSISTLSYQVQTGVGGDGPHNWSLRSDDDGYTADLHQWTEWTSGIYSQSVDLSSNPDFQNVSDTTTFRLYGSDICSGTPVASLQSQSPGIAIEGTMAAVPEPGTATLLLMGAVGVLAARRRSRD